MESHPSFAKLLGQSNGDATASTSGAPKLTAAPKSRKRKPADETPEEPTNSEPDSSEPDQKPAKKKAAAATKKGRGRPKKQAKVESTDEENSADGGDGRGEFTSKRAVERWLRSTDYE